MVRQGEMGVDGRDLLGMLGGEHTILKIIWEVKCWDVERCGWDDMRDVKMVVCLVERRLSTWKFLSFEELLDTFFRQGY